MSLINIRRQENVRLGFFRDDVRTWKTQRIVAGGRRFQAHLGGLVDVLGAWLHLSKIGRFTLKPDRFGILGDMSAIPSSLYEYELKKPENSWRLGAGEREDFWGYWRAVAPKILNSIRPECLENYYLVLRIKFSEFLEFLKVWKDWFNLWQSDEGIFVLRSE